MKSCPFRRCPRTENIVTVGGLILAGGVLLMGAIFNQHLRTYFMDEGTAQNGLVRLITQPADAAGRK